MSDRFVSIRKVADPVEADMLVDLLSQEGIPAHTPGAGQAGYLGNIAAATFEVRLMVPEDRAEEAKAIISALREFDEIDPEDQMPKEISDTDGPYRGGARTDGLPPRKKLTALAAAIVLPMIIGAFGAGHFYARDYQRGFLLLALAWLCIVLSVVWFAPLIAGVPIVVALDAWLAMKLIDSQEE